MSIDLHARIHLQKALVEYMAGRIRTFAFDDQNTACGRSSDKSVQEISRFLYSLHDDNVDHPIAVAPDCWAVLRRVVAFLATELEIRTTTKELSWPFKSWPFQDDEEWHANENQLNEFDLPEYDISTQYRIAIPWWDRIPSSIGFIVLGFIVVGVIAMLLVL